MEVFFQQLVNGLTIGCMYALIALGYTMVYGVMRMINFAHGDLVALSAFIGYSIYTILFPEQTSIFIILFVFIATAILVAFAGVFIERVAYRPLGNAPRLSAVVSALGASLMLQNGIMLAWNTRAIIFPDTLIPSTTYNIGGVTINLIQILIVVISVVLMIALYLFIEKSKHGAAIRASAINQDAARLMGINVNRIIVMIFMIGSMLGAIGGLFIALNYRSITFNMGSNYGLYAFIAAIMGGIGNIPGAMLGGILLGLFNAFISGYISSTWADTYTFLLLILLLIVRPTGILGERVAEKV